MLARTAPYILAVAVFVLDRITKIAIREGVSFRDSIPVVPGFFYIVHTENTGAAFGVLPNGTVFLALLSAAVMVLICWLLWDPHRAGLSGGPLSRMGLGLVLGGAGGNLYDRAVRGAVTDFLEFFFGSYQFPAFNVADSAITVGAFMLLAEIWRTRHQPSPQGGS